MYKQIAEDLRSKIRRGELAPGSQLLTEVQLQEDYSERPEFSSDKVSRNTVRDAIAMLVREGLVAKRPGQGTFVVEKADPFVTTLSGDPEGGESASYRDQVISRGRRAENTPPRVEIHDSSRVPELLLEEDEHLISRHQTRNIDGQPYSMQTSFYPMSYATKAPRLITAGEIEQGAVSYIEESLGIKQAGWREELRVRPANGNEIEFFKLPDKAGGSVLEAFRTAYDGAGHPIRYTVTVYATDRNRVAYEAGVVPPEAVPPAPSAPPS
jgi:GntR family transcriptional regulator